MGSKTALIPNDSEEKTDILVLFSVEQQVNDNVRYNSDNLSLSEDEMKGDL